MNWKLLLWVAILLLIGCKHEGLGGMKVDEAFQGDTAIMVEAVADGDYARADALLARGADINAKCKEGVTPLLWIMGITKDTHKIEYMLKNRADPNYVVPEKDMASAMYIAAGGNRQDILELVLKYGGNASLIGPDNLSMLMVAVMQRREEYFNLLLKHDADTNWRNQHGESAASITLTPGRFDWTLYFLERGFSADFQFLAGDVETRVASDRMLPWKAKVIDFLKSKGAVFPAGPRVKSYLKTHSVTEAELQDLIYQRKLTLDQ